ncbi:neuralized E3 ubiquitin protein ligase 1Ab [Sinocyclocheilus anshuiensis]|uniref:neuralized E3 ubiquitin protein ligase 1Ab n=1 Tax=Sinocyclocheilus anshuiensis TaxID=1608454 RepID=UPI0007B90165|nr:PREDICTED: E3 ubiquitin-protein ligase NEURL1-like [Sinocyclocheilus anshuiensis]
MCVDNSTPLWMIFHLQPHIKQISILGTSCGDSPSCSEIQRSIFSDASHLSANQIHSTAVRGFTDSFESRPQSLCSSVGTTFSSLSSESPSTPSCYAITGECLICCERAVDSVLYACGHMCVCSVCGGKLMEMSNPSCPMCRSPIRDVIKIYRSMKTENHLSNK